MARKSKRELTFATMLAITRRNVERGLQDPRDLDELLARQRRGYA